MIHYKKGYKYQLEENFSVPTSIYPEEDIDTYFIKLSKEGVLTILKGYSWDGPSGPTIDTKNFMRGSLIHDALYQLMRQGFLPQEYRVPADNELGKACKEDGMSSIRIWYILRSLKNFGGSAASPKNKKVVYTAGKD